MGAHNNHLSTHISTARQSQTSDKTAVRLPTPARSYPQTHHHPHHSYRGQSTVGSAATSLVHHDHLVLESPSPHEHDAEDRDDTLPSFPTAPPFTESVPTEVGSFRQSEMLRGSCMPEDLSNFQPEHVLRDDLNFVALTPDQISYKRRWRVSLVCLMVKRTSSHQCRMSELCPDVRDLWLRLIEGDGSSDDIWLWADRDEDWIQRNTPGNHCPDLKEEDWAAAQSALRRRLERTQCASPSILGVHVDPTLEEQRRRKARLRDATPAQRIAVISWLICVSTRKEELDYRHGLSSRLNFSLGHLIGAWHSDTSHLLGSMPAFPEKPGAWEQFEEKRTAWGCRCLHSSRLGNLAPGWFRMVVWLREDGSMDANCLNRDQCEACRSRAEQLYGTLYADYAQNTPAVSMLLAFSLVALEVIYRHFGDKLHLLPFLQGVLSRGLRAASRERVEERLRHLCRNGPRDTEFAPWINTYPEVLRNVLARYSCLINSLSRCPSLHEGSDLRDAYLDSLPVGFADDTPNLTILIGSVAWILASRCHERSSDDSTWHQFWAFLLQEDFMKVLPLPEPTNAALHLRNVLKRNSSANGPCSRGNVERGDHHWETYSHVMMFIQSKNLGRVFPGCAGCQTIFPKPMLLHDPPSVASRTFTQPGVAPHPDPSVSHTLTHPTASSSRLHQEDYLTVDPIWSSLGDIPDLTAYIQRCDVNPVASGGFGHVYRCKLRNQDYSYSEVAVKAFRPPSAQSSAQQDIYKALRREISVWNNLRHPNVLPLLGIANVFGTPISAVSPWMSGGALHSYLAEKDPELSLSHRFHLLNGVAAGLHYLHSFPVIHGDLSSANVLLNGDGEPCLSDFGLCTVIGGLGGDVLLDQFEPPRPGAIRWVAPELISGAPDVARLSTPYDIFSFGCIMFQILSGQTPWGGMTETDVVLALHRGERPRRPEHRHICDRDWGFIQKCWLSADARPSISDVVGYISSVISSLGEYHFLVSDASLQSSKNPASLSLERMHGGVVLGDNSVSHTVGSETVAPDLWGNVPLFLPADVASCGHTLDSYNPSMAPPSEEDQTLAQRTRPGDATTLRSNAAPRLRKQYKIAKIRQTLLDMLRDIDFPLRNNYLPWSSLEGDLRKHGYEITNWPSGVLRENDKGINALTARNVNKLYFALTQANGEGRPRFVGCVDRSTDQDEGVTQVQNMASSKRRLENDHHDGKGKRTRFEAVRTAEYYTGHGTEG